MFGPERHFCPVEFPWETPVQLGLARIRRSGNLRGIRVGFFEFVQISVAQSCAHAPSFVARKKKILTTLGFVQTDIARKFQGWSNAADKHFFFLFSRSPCQHKFSKKYKRKEILARIIKNTAYLMKF